MRNPSDLPSLTVGEDSYSLYDHVLFRRAVDPDWRLGYVAAVADGRLQVTAEDDGTTAWITPGQDGADIEVAPLHGEAGVEAQTRRESGGSRKPPRRTLQRKTPLRRKTPLSPRRRRPSSSSIQTDGAFTAASLQAALPTLQIVTTAGLLHAVPKPRAPHRCPAFLAEVRRLPCCGCAAPPRSQAHHEGAHALGEKTDDERGVPLCAACHLSVTDTGALPGRTPQETEVYFLAVQVELLVVWSAQLADALGALAVVPVRDLPRWAEEEAA